jgi:FMN phosphatase YigB (HAD superfamily)
LFNERFYNNISRVVLANGTLKLQLDIVKSAGITFHALLPSSLIGHSKVRSFPSHTALTGREPRQPDPRIYEQALRHLECRPSEVVMVAAHAYDLRAATKL